MIERNGISGGLLIGFALALASCADTANARPFSQAQADVITSGCGAQSSTLDVQGDEIFLRPDPSFPYETTACIMKKLAEAGQAERINANGNELSAGNEGH